MNWGLVIIHKINHDLSQILVSIRLFLGIIIIIIRLVAYTNKFIINGV